MSLNTDRKSSIGLEKLVIWPQTADAIAGATYGAATEMTKSLMTASDNPSVVQAEQSADNQVVDEVYMKTGGELSIGLTNMNSADRVALYNETADGDTNVTNKDDVIPYVCVAYMTKRNDGKVNLYKYPKAKFVEQQESFETVKKDGITFSVSSLKGNYIPTIANGDARYVRRGLDPTTDATFITEWFTTAATYKPTV